MIYNFFFKRFFKIICLSKPYEYVVEDEFDKALKSMKKNKGKDNKPKRKYQETREG